MKIAKNILKKTRKVVQELFDHESFILSTAISQKNLMVSYRSAMTIGSFPFKLSEVGFKEFSQNDEDGILLYIFSLIGFTNRKGVEICAGDGIECNLANLIINHGWIALLVDGKPENTERAKQFYSNHPNTLYWPPKIKNSWVTKDNVNDIIVSEGFNGEIDLLSLDLDGVDYYVWKAVDVIKPRVVVLEINHLWGAESSVSVPYSDAFVADFSQYGSDYAGASLQAFVKLGKDKGYRLVGTNSIATNAFFVRSDINCEWLAEIDPSSCFNHPRAQFGNQVRLPKVKDKPWVDI
jgi:hypothetical protein